MQSTKKIIYLSTVFALASGSYAYAAQGPQDAEPILDKPAVETPVIDAFTAADTNTDGALDRDEFVAFVVVKADSGDLDYKGVKLSGEYDNHFNTKDYNADGLLTAEELRVHKVDSKTWSEPEVPAEAPDAAPEPEEVN